MLNLSDYKEHFCEYILFRYAWANEFVKEPFPENLYEYYDSFAKAYRYLIEKIGYDDIQLVTIRRPSAYGEYEPYQIVQTMDEFRERVLSM